MARRLRNVDRVILVVLLSFALAVAEPWGIQPLSDRLY
jgi:hypothetical protein